MTTPSSTKAKPAPRGLQHGGAEEDFLKVPRCLIYAGRFLDAGHPLNNPRYRMLILALWARQHKDHPIRDYWENLARDTGVKPSSVRRWAHELRDAKLLRIVNHKGPVRPKENGKPGRRDERNTFDLSPLWKTLDEKLEPKRKEQRPNRREERRKGLVAAKEAAA